MNTELTSHAPSATTQIVTDNGTTWTLEYYLQTYENSYGKQLYGIKVDKLDLYGIVAESSETYAITESHSVAASILSYLACGTVPPCVLLEMVDEWFSAHV